MKSTDHFRGSWNANIGEQCHTAEVGYKTRIDDVTRAASLNNPFDSAFADMVSTKVNNVDDDFKSKLERAISGKPKVTVEEKTSKTPMAAAPSESFIAMQQKLALASSSMFVPQIGKESANGPNEPQNKCEIKTETKEQEELSTSFCPFASPETQPDPVDAVTTVSSNLFCSEDKVEDLFANMDDFKFENANFESFATDKTLSSDLSSDAELFDSQKTVSSTPEVASFDPFANFSEDLSKLELSPSQATVEEANCADEYEGNHCDDDKVDTLSKNSEDTDFNEENFHDDNDEDEDDNEDFHDESCDTGIVEPESGVAGPSSFANAIMFKSYLMTPLKSKKLMKCVLIKDFDRWIFKDPTTGLTLMTAFKRTDGWKSLATSVYYAISMSQDYSNNIRRGSTETDLLGKLKSDMFTGRFELFDTGKSARRAAGAMQTRRELVSMKFEKVLHNTSDQYRRRLRVCTPANEQYRRPTSKKEKMFERHKRGDPSVLILESHMPGRPYKTPQLADYKGMAVREHINNVMLHDPSDHNGETRFVLGKSSANRYNCYFKDPISPIGAFGIALSSIASRVSKDI